MKKSALALAVAAALVGFGSVANADTTLYGSARVSVDYSDEDPSLSTGALPTDNGVWDVFNNTSRLGVRGEEDLGGGLAAIYQYEFGVDTTEGGNFNSNRPKWVGLKGASWGSVTAGTQWTPYYNVAGLVDVFNSSKTWTNDSYLGNDYGLRMDNSVMYSTPVWSGFSAQVMLVMNGSVAPQDPQSFSQLKKTVAENRLPANLSDGVDMWQMNATYKNGPFSIGGAYMAVDTPDFYRKDGDLWTVAVGYNAGPFNLGLTYEDGDLNELYIGTSQNIYLVGSYTFGNNVIRLAYGRISPDDNTIVDANGVVLAKQGDIDNYRVGYQYNLSKRTRLWAEYIGRSVDGNGLQDNSIYADKNVVSLGTRVDF